MCALLGVASLRGGLAEGNRISPEAPRRSSDFYPYRACCCLLACCLLAACLLLAAAKPSRSTLDAKKGYKTKTGSTSSVSQNIQAMVTTAHATDAQICVSTSLQDQTSHKIQLDGVDGSHKVNTKYQQRYKGLGELSELINSYL